ncbi:MAG: glycoside hydrolase, partial [Planctomycetota bacterium JB042]
MNRSVCIHGHFYQPPRENPVTDEVPEQPSAAPAHDWNERIADECYAPNAAARVLGADGAVERTISNYARMGFDFGPTLLRWLERRRPDVHRAVVDADVESAKRFGRGSAIAQVYHHAILPLSSPRDRRTEIRWGVRDFELRFGRAPEGMWLSECAADVPTLEELAAQGIAFTILSPRQAARVRPPRSAAWVAVDAETLDPRRAYRVPLPSGRSIAAFFYDGPLSQGVAFEGLTDDGAAFADRILGAFRDDDDDGADEAQLVHLATDGESYGHHRKFAEMGLAFALMRLEAAPDVDLTNHASFLAAHPPTWDAEIVEPSSWSCA